MSLVQFLVPGHENLETSVGTLLTFLCIFDSWPSQEVGSGLFVGVFLLCTPFTLVGQAP